MNKHVGMVFPGQGSQAVGMLAELADHYPLIKATFEQASAILGYDLWLLSQQGPVEQLNLTEYSQPAMLTTGVALYRLWQTVSPVKPMLLAGHSLGEYPALVASGALSFAEGVRLVAERGRLMQQAVPAGEGAMAAIVGLTDQQVAALCTVAEEQQTVSPANYNSIGQVVIAGHTAAVNRAVQLAIEAGAKLAKVIPVSVPCHCSLLKDMAMAFKEVLQGVAFKTPAIPVINNVAVEAYRDAEHIRTSLTQQLYSPVHWVATIEHFKQSGVQTILEMGPSRVLTGLIKRIDRTLTVYPIYDQASLASAQLTNSEQ